MTKQEQRRTRCQEQKLVFILKNWFKNGFNSEKTCFNSEKTGFYYEKTGFYSEQRIDVKNWFILFSSFLLKLKSIGL